MSFDDLIVYIILSLAVLAMLQIYRKLSGENFLASGVKRFLLICVLIAAASALLYWRTRSLDSSLSAFDAWVIALDIAFMYAVLVLPLLLALLYLFNLVGKGIFWLLAAAIYAPFKIADGLIPESSDRTPKARINLPESIIQVCVWAGFGLLMVVWAVAQVTRWVLPIIGAIWSTLHLLRATPEFQELFLGAFDSSLGWNIPTSFRFTTMSQHIRLISVVFTKNEVITTIAGTLAAVLGIILTIGGLAKAISNIGEAFSPVHGASGLPSRPRFRKGEDAKSQ